MKLAFIKKTDKSILLHNKQEFCLYLNDLEVYSNNKEYPGIFVYEKKI